MATVIDSLVVTLNLDPRNFTAGQRQALAQLRKFEEESTRSTKRGEEAAQRQLNFLSRIRTEAIGLVGALAGAYGIKQFVANLVTGEAAVGRFARATGLAAKDVADFETALGLGGAPEGTGFGALQNLNNLLQAFTQNLPEGAKLLEFYGRLRTLTGVEINPQSNIIEQLKQIAEATKIANQKVPGQGGNLLQQYGFDQQAISNLAKGRDELNRLLQRAAELRKTTGDTTQSAEDLLGKWREISQLLQGLARPAMPWVDDLIKKLTDLLEQQNKHITSGGKEGSNAIMDFLFGQSGTDATNKAFGELSAWLGANVGDRIRGFFGVTDIRGKADTTPQTPQSPGSIFPNWLGVPLPGQHFQPGAQYREDTLNSRYGDTSGPAGRANTIVFQGPTNIVTQATDAEGFKAALMAEGSRRLASQANGGQR
jgi:hypothetical protein